MKKLDITEELTDFVLERQLENNEEIVIIIGGRKVCIAVPTIYDEYVEFKLRPVTK